MFNLLPPGMAMKLLRVAIEKELKTKVPVYTMVFKPLQKQITFEIPFEDKIRAYPYDNPEKLCTIVESLAKKHVKENEKIDVLRVTHNGDTVTADIFYRDENNNKLHLNKTL